MSERTIKCPACGGTGEIDTGGTTPWACRLCDAYGRMTPERYAKYLETVQPNPNCFHPAVAQHGRAKEAPRQAAKSESVARPTQSPDVEFTGGGSSDPRPIRVERDCFNPVVAATDIIGWIEDMLVRRHLEMDEVQAIRTKVEYYMAGAEALGRQTIMDMVHEMSGKLCSDRCIYCGLLGREHKPDCPTLTKFD